MRYTANSSIAILLDVPPFSRRSVVLSAIRDVRWLRLSMNQIRTSRCTCNNCSRLRSCCNCIYHEINITRCFSYLLYSISSRSTYMDAAGFFPPVGQVQIPMWYIWFFLVNAFRIHISGSAQYGYSYSILLTEILLIFTFRAIFPI